MTTDDRRQTTGGCWAFLGVLLAGCVMGVIGLCGMAGAAEKGMVRRVVVAGVREVSEEEILRGLVTRRGMVLDSALVRQDMRRILGVYRDRGFWQVAVPFPEITMDDGQVAVRFRVQEGARTRIDSVRVDGDLALSVDDVMDALNLPRGTPLVPQSLAGRFEAVLTLYENRGYPFCEVKPDVQFFEDGRAAVLVSVASGPLVRIDSVRFEGNRLTRETVLARSAHLLVGQLYDQRRVDRVLRGVRRLPFLVGVEDPQLVRTGDRMMLVIRVQEARSARVDGGVGFAPGVGHTGSVVTGAFTLDVLNFAGGGRQGHLSWARTGEDASDLRVTYREPWFLGAPFGGRVSVVGTERSGYAEQQIGLGIDVPVAADGRVLMDVARSRVLPDSSGLGQFLNSDVWTFSMGGQIDRRDDVWNPRRGWRGAAGVAVARVTYWNGDQTRWRYEADGQVLAPMGRRWVLSLRGFAQAVTQTNGVPLESRIRLGGASSIRGYREEAFWVTEACWGSVEWRYVMGVRSRAFAFADLGMLNDTQGRLWPLGYGFGLRADSRMGTVGLVFGWARGESPGQGKVHVRLAQAF